MTAVSSLLFLIPSFGRGTELNCHAYKNSPRPLFFELSRQHRIVQDYEERLIRKGAATFWDLDTSMMSLPEIKDGTLNPYTTVVEDPAGKLYATVDIGYGNEQSIRYFFEYGTLNFAPIAVLDGVCFDQGQAIEIPVEGKPKFNGKAVFQCRIEDANSPVTSFEMSIETEDGIYTGTEVLLQAKLNPNFENLVSLRGSDLHEESHFPSYLQASSAHAAAKLGFDTNIGKRGARRVQISFVADSDKSNIAGRAYPDTNRGYWAPEAHKFSHAATCTVQGSLKEVRYKRAIRY